jgi:hypothetical protein
MAVFFVVSEITDAPPRISGNFERQIFAQEPNGKDTGIDLRSGQKFRVTASGKIWVEGNRKPANTPIK